MSQKDSTVELLTGKDRLGKKSKIPAKLGTFYFLPYFV